MLAALIHDAGMLAVPTRDWLHGGPLDDCQRRTIEAHCRAGAEWVARLFPDDSAIPDAVAGHHEYLDGSGYPAGLREVQIPQLTRLLTVCDTYVAQCLDRPHRPARDPRTAIADTLLLAEQGKLDRSCAERLLHLSFYPAGTVVELADGQIGLVVATHQSSRDLSAPARPVLAILTNHQGELLPGPHFLDLVERQDQSIVRALSNGERRGLLGMRYPELVH